MPYEIKPLKSARAGIKLTDAQREYILPPFGTTYFCGRTGSGKTTIICRLLKDKDKLRNYYDKIYVFCMSPCMDLVEHCPQIEEEHLYGEEPEKLKELYDNNKKAVKTMGFDKAPHTLFILDDIVQSNIMMNSKVLRDLFFGGTHAKCSVWLVSQHYKSCPLRLRQNFHAVILCHGLTHQEKEKYVEEWQSAHLNKKEFLQVVNYALDEPYSFLFMNATNPNKKKMYRKKFDEVLVLEIVN
jgi:hypothetical protein